VSLLALLRPEVLQHLARAPAVDSLGC
jgi:hypothetical protein